MFDKDNSGTINFDEFGALWKYVTDWQNCFRSFDRDNSGTIDRGELTTALTTFGYRLSPATIELMVKKFDRIGQGTIAFDDFIQLCVALHVIQIITLYSQLRTNWAKIILVCAVFRL